MREKKRETAHSIKSRRHPWSLLCLDLLCLLLRCHDPSRRWLRIVTINPSVCKVFVKLRPPSVSASTRCSAPPPGDSHVTLYSWIITVMIGPKETREESSKMLVYLQNLPHCCCFKYEFRDPSRQEQVKTLFM